MAKQEIDYTKLSELKTQLGAACLDIEAKYLKIEGIYDEIFDENYWTGNRAVRFREEMKNNLFILKGKNGGFYDNFDSDCDSMLAFLDSVLAEVQNTDATSSEKIAGATGGEQ